MLAAGIVLFLIGLLGSWIAGSEGMGAQDRWQKLCYVVAIIGVTVIVLAVILDFTGSNYR